MNNLLQYIIDIVLLSKNENRQILDWFDNSGALITYVPKRGEHRRICFTRYTLKSLLGDNQPHFLYIFLGDGKQYTYSEGKLTYIKNVIYD